ncbi:hypothetical protein PAEPH01_0496 [Pancytospora epiphaga]|nr:hypothetical protein PAEPH01_0496 [Pancytospora epiphaga]
MRGSDYLKAILKANNETKIVLLKSYIVYYIITIATYAYYKMSPLAFAILSIPDITALGLLHQQTAPVFVYENGAKKLVDVRSVNSSGLPSFAFDLMFWGLLCKILVIFGKKWLFLYLGIPFSLFYEYIYKPYKSIKKI